MKNKTSLLCIVAVAVNMSACSYVKSLFPDKEKDYQFTAEIPPLVLPADLAGDTIAKVPGAAKAPDSPDKASTATATETPDSAPAVPVAEKTGSASAAPATEAEPDIERKLIQVGLVDAAEGAKHLRIGAPTVTAWRMVGKALSRNSIEVTNRNQEERLFYVQYDPNNQEVEDGSVWDEVVFFFKGLETKDQEYVVKLVENSRETDVIITDKEQKPVSDRASLRLLTLLHDTIKADLAK
jgi:outer membrane protein assembly factor BamC